jgi:RNA polymerase sigma-70 factor, ECF subfamily
VEAETRRRVLTALAGLPDHYRTALLLKDGRGLRAEGVAQAMGVTVPAVRSILHRARSALRERLTGVQS